MCSASVKLVEEREREARDLLGVLAVVAVARAQIANGLELVDLLTDGALACQRIEDDPLADAPRVHQHAGCAEELHDLGEHQRAGEHHVDALGGHPGQSEPLGGVAVTQDSEELHDLGPLDLEPIE